jgi:hypothetical protein
MKCIALVAILAALSTQTMLAQEDSSQFALAGCGKTQFEIKFWMIK